MLLRKITGLRFFQLTRQFFAWTGLIFMLLVLITAISSLDLIRINQFALFDVVLTYAFVMLWAFLDALLAALLLAGLAVLAERLLHRSLEKWFRIPLIIGFIIIWFSLLKSFIPLAGGA